MNGLDWLREKRGSALVSVLSAVAVLSVLTVAFIGFALQNRLITERNLENRNSSYIAEAALFMVLFDMMGLRKVRDVLSIAGYTNDLGPFVVTKEITDEYGNKVGEATVTISDVNEDAANMMGAKITSDATAADGSTSRIEAEIDKYNFSANLNANVDNPANSPSFKYWEEN